MRQGLEVGGGPATEQVVRRQVAGPLGRRVSSPGSDSPGVLVEADDGTLVWFWIGRHDEYDRLIA